MHPRITRLCRTSLRGLLSLLALLCVALGLVVHQVHQQQRAIAWVEGHGGSVWYDYEYDDLVSVMKGTARPPGPKWLHSLIGEDYFRSPVVVTLRNDSVDDISPLAHLSDLRDVLIMSYQLQNFTPLSELEKLESVSLITPPAEREINRLRKALPNCSVNWEDRRLVEY